MDEGGVVVCSTNPLNMESSSSSSSSSKSKLCDECKTSEFKYKCPACSVRSCSLPCVKAHKHRSGCTGKRQQLTEFVPLSKFDNNLLLSDYNMLEDVKRIADSAKRRRVQLCGKYFGSGIPFHLRSLLKAALNRNTRLFFLPPGMSKRETNRTFFNHRSKSISWTIEWRFHSTNIKLFDHEIHESSKLCSVIQKHLETGPINHPLKPFCLEPVESLKFFISKHPKQPRSPFRELDIYAPIREQLAKLVIIEYPVIHVFLPSHIINFEVVKDIVPQPAPPKLEPVNESQPEPKGVFFKEEEFKDHNSTDTQVLDLMNKSNDQTETKDVGLNHKSPDATNNVDELGVVDLLNFDFDPELIDVYSNLISDSNPDDFLDFDGLLCDDLPTREDLGECEVIEEELEEGEIPDSD